MIGRVLAGLLTVSAWNPVAAQTPPAEPALEHSEAFERAFASSSYIFDACGDPLAGRMFRRALNERFAHCPFTPEARSRFVQRTRGQQAKSRQMLDDMVESHGGLPVQLDGMPLTCHEQHATETYRQVRARLEQYAHGDIPAEAVIAVPCDAKDITP